MRGFVGSLTNLMPNPVARLAGDVADDPDTAAGGDGRNEYAMCALLLGYFAVQRHVETENKAGVTGWPEHIYQSTEAGRGWRPPCA